ncbi:hypothetical protein S40285_02015 [Stachybotrys chlorohalonatus IBT 40285]|uniref:ribonuclease Z n=1 Tax=Stachybotrys chlorohalonatus (strain IBT 40285) TaxID=1283841 RepID=A0A084R197_STAC4|nr:hypothetical protein S40285_02015 [Stachybotrys chlorohalonata IBT 40285]
MSTTVEIAIAPALDTPGTTIFVHNEGRNYLFGRMPEGAQRAFASRRLNTGSAEHIFLTGTHCWENLGGLIGFLLTVAAIEETSQAARLLNNAERAKNGRSVFEKVYEGLKIHGTHNLSHILAACRSGIFRQKLKVRAIEYMEDPRATGADMLTPDWEDNAIRVWKLPTRRARSSNPPKRRRSSGEARPDAAGAPPDTSQETTASALASLDPEVAAFILESVMFEDQDTPPLWVSRKLSQLKPTDKALKLVKNTLSVYRGPYATSENTDIPDPDGTAFVWTTSDSGEEAIDINLLTHMLLPRATYSNTSMSYIVKCRDRRGKFDGKKAAQLGLKPSVHYRMLTAGQSVELDGKTINPQDVMGEPIPGKGFIVADVASRDFLESFLARPEWKNADLMANVNIMYWILGPGLASDTQIHKFINEHPDIRHVLCSEDTCPNMIVHESPARLQTKLRLIDPERYPMPEFQNQVFFQKPNSKATVELGLVGKQAQLMPHFILEKREAAKFAKLEDAIAEVEPDIVAMAKEAQAQATDPALLARIEEEEKDIPNRDADITALGTGSSAPSKYRNVSGTLIRVPGVGNYLLDCGEGTLGQIRRLFGPDEARAILRDLKCIVISHLHADHHLGVPLLVKAWYDQALREGNTANVAIICNNRYRTLLQEVAQVEDIGFHRLRFPGLTLSGAELRTHALPAGEENFGLTSLKRVYVNHCWKAAATELELTSGLRIAYSGDCRPSADFARECRGAHLLVHECTFGDDMADLALAKKHSTMGEALHVARQMRARRTLLTHFSQRYTKRCKLTHSMAQDQEQVFLLATDFMTVKLGDFRKAACFLPAVQRLIESLPE